MTNQRKGDLEVTLLEARNLGVKKSSNLYCTLSISRENRSYQSSISKGSQWNQTFTLDLLSLDNEELSIELFKQRRIKKDKFLGQLQIPIKALKLPKEATWCYLTDRPEADAMGNPPPWILLINPEHNLKKSSSNGASGSSLNLNRNNKKSYIISGEILIKLQFVHRLLRARSQNAIKKANSMYSSVGPSSDLTGIGKHNKRLSRAVSNMPISEYESSSPSSSSSHSHSHYPSSPSSHPPTIEEGDEEVSNNNNNNNNNENNGPLEKPNDKEVIIIEEALKEKQQLAREKLQRQKEMLKFMSLRIMDKEKSEGANAVKDEKMKLEEIQQNMIEMENALKLSSEKAPRERMLEKRVSALHLHDLKKSSPRLQGRTTPHKVSYSDLPRLDGPEADLLNHSLSHLSSHSPSHSPSHSSSSLSSSPPLLIVSSSPPSSSSPLVRAAHAHAQQQQEEINTLHSRVRLLEGELEKEREMNAVLKTNNSLLEREVKRLEGEIDRDKWERERFEREEKWKERLLEIERLFLKQQLVFAHKPVEDVEEEKTETTEDANGKDAVVDERETQLNTRVEAAQSMLKEVDDTIKQTKLLKQQLHTELVENRLKKRQQFLKKIQEQHRSLESRLSLLQDEKEESEVEELDEDQIEEDAEDDEPLSPRSKNIHRRRKSEAQLDMLVVKLEKLDKLDELLRKIDTIKVVPGPSGGESVGEASGVVSSSSQDYTGMKAELEQLQTVIFDDTGKYTEKEKMDANIKYEKTFQIYQRTDEYRKDMTALLEERRKRNEPLNKDALAKVIERYSPDNVKGNPDLKQKLIKAPELNLIFMDPKAILAKHQNDFQQYQLNKLDLDELRAVRACLPKFRNDQAKQNDWVESLEQKIEIYAVNPPVKKDPVQSAATKFKKPKATKQSSPGDFLVELLQRFKNKPEEKEKEKEEDKKGSRRNTVSFRSPLRLRSFSKSDPSE